MRTVGRGGVEMRVGCCSLPRSALVAPRRAAAPATDTLRALPLPPPLQVSYSEKQKRVAVLVSKLDHCLYDLLIRRDSGELNCQIPVVISNHPGAFFLCVRVEGGGSRVMF